MSGVCGLVDFTGAPVELGVLRSMAEASAYRGPDGLALWSAGEAGFAHLSLHATPQHRSRKQPFSLADVWVVADARLDNRAALIRDLAHSGLADPAPPDDAIILAAYLRWGVSCTERLVGDFAFAIWDTRRRRLFCAVDPLGVKPLYYARSASLLVFASDALQVLTHPAISSALDEIMVADYLAGRREDPQRSFFRDVHRLPAGHRLTVHPEGHRVDRYWTPRIEPIVYKRDEDYAEHFLNLFRRAVSDRLSVPPGERIAIAMSGGLDSCSVAAVAQRSLLAAGSPGLLTGSFVFPRLTQCDERTYIEVMARELGLDAELVDAERTWDLHGFVGRRLSLDTPFTGWDSSYGEMLRHLGNRKVRVLLTGHGGDDLLRGSALAYADRLRKGDWGALAEVVRFARESSKPISHTIYRYLGKPLFPRATHRLLQHLVGRTIQHRFPDWLLPEFVSRIGFSEPSSQSSVASAKEDIYENTVGTAWYDRAVNWHDRNAARFGMEARHPFLDVRLFEYVLSIPPEQLCLLGTNKPLLRRAMAGVLPEVVRTRKPKTRFTSFLDSVMRDRDAAKIEQMLQEPLSGELGFVDRDRLLRAYGEYREGRSEIRSFLWYAVSFEFWLRKRLQARLHGEAVAA